jgi:hypothetical protein
MVSKEVADPEKEAKVEKRELSRSRDQEKAMIQEKEANGVEDPRTREV